MGDPTMTRVLMLASTVLLGLGTILKGAAWWSRNEIASEAATMVLCCGAGMIEGLAFALLFF